MIVQQGVGGMERWEGVVAGEIEEQQVSLLLRFFSLSAKWFWEDSCPEVFQEIIS